MAFVKRHGWSASRIIFTLGILTGILCWTTTRAGGFSPRGRSPSAAYSPVENPRGSPRGAASSPFVDPRGLKPAAREVTIGTEDRRLSIRVSQPFPPLAALPAVPVPADNPITPAKVKLGRMLYFDKRTSGDTEISCASCHDPAMGWGDERDVSTGYPGSRHWRNGNTVVNSAYLQKLFWAGESTSLEAQAKSAITGNLAGNGDPVMIEERLAQIPEYVQLFKEAFGVERPSFVHVLRAIATFERAEVISNDSPFDQYMRGDKSAMSESALRGRTLFEGKANCIKCHNGPLLTDEKFHNVGVPNNPVFEEDTFAQTGMRYQHYIRGVPEALYRKADRDLGLYYTTKQEKHKGLFRTPPLRYLIYTFPYMHNGVFLVLEEVVDFYDEGGGDGPNKSPLLIPLNLTDSEKEDLVEFLNSLSGSELIISPPELPPYVPMQE